MDKTKYKILIADVAASYIRRELDGVFYDQFMSSTLGRKLVGLPTKQKHALEFISFAVSALVVNSNSNPSAIRTFINSIISDFPPEIAKRMMDAGYDLSPVDVETELNALSDEQLLIMVEHLTETKSSNTYEEKQNSSTVKRQTFFNQLADNIADARQKRRANKKK
jgi:hypothetical protein